VSHQLRNKSFVVHYIRFRMELNLKFCEITCDATNIDLNQWFPKWAAPPPWGR